MIASLDFSTLNSQQRNAVLCPGGPIQIFAGAGSGKTRVITYRIARLLNEGVAPHQILAVTFTNKAAREMRERLEYLVGESAKNLWMGTFHSICARILRVDGGIIGIDPQFVVYDDGDQLNLVKDIIKQKNIDEKSVQPRAILSIISKAKERLLTPEEYSNHAVSFIEKMAVKIYWEYNQALKRSSALDFDDLLYHTVKLFEHSSEVLSKYQHRFLHILIDEYQDVNFVQYKFASLISSKHRNITIVGDDDQSIYAWRGADVSLMLKFSSDYPDANVFTLDQNYRSTKKILRAAHEVVRHNRSRAAKQLWTENPDGTHINLIEAETEQDEATLVADTILKEVRAGKRKFGDFAVLYRTNAQSRVLEEIFLNLRIPHILVGGQRFYERKEIKDMITYLRLSLNPNDNGAFKRIINVPARGIGATSLNAIEEWAYSKSISLWNAIKDPGLQEHLSKKALSSILGFIEIVESANNLSKEGPVTPVFKHLLNRTNYMEMLRVEKSEEATSRLENLQELLNVTTLYDSTSEEPTLFGFLESVALIADVDHYNESGEAITLMTLHSSKGLEFPVVYMVGMEDGIFPSSRSFYADHQMEEERRLCYVGMTRAKEELYMLHATRRYLYGQPTFNDRSRFISDIPEDLYVTIGTQTFVTSSRNRNFRYERAHETVATMQEPSIKQTLQAPTWIPPFAVGQKVKHTKFGIGVVISCNPIKNDAEITVAFPGIVGVKKLLQSMAKLGAA